MKQKSDFFWTFFYLFPFICIYENGADDVMKWNLFGAFFFFVAVQSI